MKWLKPLVFILCLLPFFILLLQGLGAIARGFGVNLPFDPAVLLGHLGLQQDLGANPIQKITFATGTWTLRFLVITLAITPLRKITSLSWLIKFRRMLGLFAFFYACLHFTTYIWLDQFFSWSSIVKDVAKRPFITAGFTAFVLMIPLAITSTRGMIRRLGGKRWQRLHRLVYFSAVAGVIHYYWQVKSDIRLPLLYGGIVAILLGYRAVTAWRNRRKQSFLAQPKSAPARSRPMETAEDL